MVNLPLLTSTFSTCNRRLKQTTNVGESDDWSDLYYLIDYVTFAMDQNYDQQPCGAGCSTCCQENAVFRVSALEWQAIRTFLESEAGVVARLLWTQTCHSYSPYHQGLAKVAAFWAEEPALDSPNPFLKGLPTRCPLLAEDRCSVYAVRPLLCRAYGYFAVKVLQQETLLMCKALGVPFLDQLRESGLEEAPLPNYEPFWRRVTQLNESGPVKPLPLWLLETFQL